jgi:NADPH2:quinone reductase
MRACWYERHGDAAAVLVSGEMDTPLPAAGEVRVRLTFSGVNPGDTKKRLGWQGAPMPFPRVIPHSDGAGVIDAVGAGVYESRVGERVWVWGAQSYRAFGTAAEFTVVPSAQALALPDSVSDEIGACLGIPGITAHRAVFADGPVAGQTILVHGVLGAVSSLAAQLAADGGARVIGTVRRASDLADVSDAFVAHAIALDDGDAESSIRSRATEASSPPTRRRSRAQTFPSGPCSSTTSPSDSSAATTSLHVRSSRQHTP